MSKMGISIPSIWDNRWAGEKSACRAKFCSDHSHAHSRQFSFKALRIMHYGATLCYYSSC